MNDIQEQEKIADKWYQRWRTETVYVFTVLLIAAIIWRELQHNQDRDQWHSDYQKALYELKLERAHNDELSREIVKQSQEQEARDDRMRQTVDRAFDLATSSRSASRR